MYIGLTNCTEISLLMLFLMFFIIQQMKSGTCVNNTLYFGASQYVLVLLIEVAESMDVLRFK
jgi:hypothetical protein